MKTSSLKSTKLVLTHDRIMAILCLILPSLFAVILEATLEAVHSNKSSATNAHYIIMGVIFPIAFAITMTMYRRYSPANRSHRICRTVYANNCRFGICLACYLSNILNGTFTGMVTLHFIIQATQ